MAMNTTFEALPSSPPRDVTVTNLEPGTVSLSWQPPKVPNGLIVGEYSFLTTPNTKRHNRSGWWNSSKLSLLMMMFCFLPSLGYIVSYTTDLQSKDGDWITETVPGDKMTLTIKALSLGTTYYFHVKAKNRKGSSTSSPVVSVTTPATGFGGIAELGNPKGSCKPAERLYWNLSTVTAKHIYLYDLYYFLRIVCRQGGQVSAQRQ